MRINMREFAQMPQAGVREQTNPGPPGSVVTFPTRNLVSAVHTYHIPSALNNTLIGHSVLITDISFMFTGQNSDHSHDGGPECCALGVWYQFPQAGVLFVAEVLSDCGCVLILLVLLITILSNINDCLSPQSWR
jgi:hypothetical protein